MADFLGLMKQAAEFKSKMEAMQAELDHIEVEGTAGGGLFSVKLSGKGEVRSTQIDDSLLRPDQKPILQDLIVAAHADSTRCGAGKDLVVRALERITPSSPAGTLQDANILLKDAASECPDLGDAWYYRSLVEAKLGRVFEVFEDDQDAINSFFPGRDFQRYDILEL